MARGQIPADCGEERKEEEKEKEEGGGEALVVKG